MNLNFFFKFVGGMELPKKLLTEMVILPSERPEVSFHFI